MNETLKAIVRILEEGSPELKVAAAQVLGEMRPPEVSVVQALAARLKLNEAFVAPFLLDALAKIGSEAAIEVLLARLDEGGAMGERVRGLLSRAGPQAARTIAERFDEAPDELQIHFLDVLGRNLQREGLAVLQRALLSRHKALVEKAAEVLNAAAPRLNEAQRRHLVEGLQKALAKEGVVEPESIAVVLIALAKLDPNGARSLLLKHAGPRFPSTVRRAALRALAGVPLAPAQADGLFDLLFEDDIQLVHAGMDLLRDHVEIGAAARSRLKKLLEGERDDLKVFALRALRGCRTQEIGRLCLPFLLNGNSDFRAAAAETLGQNPQALELLLKSFQSEKDAERARAMVAPLIALRESFKDVHVQMLAERAARLIPAADPLGEITLTVLIGARPEDGAREMVGKAMRLRKAKKINDGLSILMRLAHTPHLDSDGRYQLAVGKLLADHDRSGHASVEGGDATMGHFGALVREGFPLFDKLKKDAQIVPELMLRLGTHFAASVGPERRFGYECLKHVAEKHSRAKAGEEAKQMLRASGQ